ncbi:hypothetical protein [Colwellia echini]|uniref:Uncharacterized protein n=1 Tax=Colwellia echini TaxID=1982103 RepID=A0ABY3N0H3_9GAMM|nr:hypothetical protein [Colwellia echini]TYK66742.1 hypothetical protein CWS31_002795 [Colwellia echini]
MSATGKYQAQEFKQLVDTNNITYAHLYLEQLMLFPVDIQDKIIEDISQLSYCNSDAIAQIFKQYSN